MDLARVSETRVNRDLRQTVRCELAIASLQRYGQVRIRVFGASMLPAVRPGDLVVIHRAAIEDVQVGDVVFSSIGGTRLMLHRVIAKGREGGQAWIRTQGDSQPWPDTPFGAAEMLGRAVAVIRNGKHCFPGKRHPLLSFAFRRSCWLRGLAASLYWKWWSALCVAR